MTLNSNAGKELKVAIGLAKKERFLKGFLDYWHLNQNALVYAFMLVIAIWIHLGFFGSAKKFNLARVQLLLLGTVKMKNGLIFHDRAGDETDQSRRSSHCSLLNFSSLLTTVYGVYSEKIFFHIFSNCFNRLDCIMKLCGISAQLI